MVTMDTVALMFTIVTVAVGATYTISRKLSTIEEKVDSLEKKVLEMRAELKADINRVETSLKTDMKKLEEGLKADMQELETDLKASMQKLEADLKADIANLKADIKKLDDRTYETSKLLGRLEAELAAFVKKEGVS